MICIQSAHAKPKKHIHSEAIDLRRLEKKYAEVGSIEADFVQEVYQAALARTKSSKGVILLSKPGLVRWETLEPERSILVSNGKKLWYFAPDAGGKSKEKGQVIVRQASELTRNALLGILNGSIAIEKEFVLKSSQKQTNGEELSLEPKKPLQDVQTVQLVVDSKYLISEVKLLHASGNQTKIRLQNIRVGDKLSTNLFKFTPPAGVPVVEP